MNTDFIKTFPNMLNDNDVIWILTDKINTFELRKNLKNKVCLISAKAVSKKFKQILLDRNSNHTTYYIVSYANEEFGRIAKSINEKFLTSHNDIIINI